MYSSFHVFESSYDLFLLQAKAKSASHQTSEQFSPLLTHAIILGSWARILRVNISSHTAFGEVGIVELYLLTLTKGLQNPLMERLHMHWPQSAQRGTLSSTIQLHTALCCKKGTWSMIHSSSFSCLLTNTREWGKAEEEDAASERRKSHSLVDSWQMENHFLDFIFFLFLLAGDQFLCPRLLCPHMTALLGLCRCCNGYGPYAEFLC